MTLILDLNQAAKFLQIQYETVRLMAKSGKLPGAMVGRSWRFIEADLLHWIRGQYRAPPSQFLALFRAKISGAPAETRTPASRKYWNATARRA